MKRLVAIGEATYDVVFRNGQPSSAVVGGSVLNTSVSLGRLGCNVIFVSRLGIDRVGKLSVDFLKANRINCEYIARFDGNSRLALAFMDENNNASYGFYKEEMSPNLHFPELAQGDVVLFGSTNAITDNGRNHLLQFLKVAHNKNLLTVYDPNIREDDPVKLIELKEKVTENFRWSKLVKGSVEDFLRLYQTYDADFIYNEISKYGVEVLVVTAGNAPVRIRTPMLSESYPVIPLNPISTIGAGDNFNAGLIYGLSLLQGKYSTLNDVSKEQWDTMLKLAIEFSSEVCMSNDNYISVAFADKVLKEKNLSEGV
jgi:fructokinase